MDNIHLIQLNSYERPTITEEKNQQWVGIGDNNDYYQCLIDAFMDSTTNNAVINGIVNQIYGKGLDATDSNRKPEQYAQMKGLLKPKDLRRVCQDLKLLGEGAFQVTYKGNQIDSITHFPRETLRAEKCGEDGVIKNYLYSADWSKVTKNTVLKKFPVFGSGAKNEIFIIRRYITGFFYYSPADYQTSYATLEREIADYLINDAQSSFSGTKIVNFNNGVPDREKQDQIKNQVLSKLTGSHGEKVIIAFNSNQESKTTIDDCPLNDAPSHYEYLSSESQRKIMLTHRVTSPLLLGLRDGNGGLGSNADEIKNASLLFNNVVIKPYQDLIADALNEMFATNNISLNLYFKTIEPLEFMDVDDTLDAETIEEETGVKQEDEEENLELAIHKMCFHEIADDELNKLADELIEAGEDIDEDEWELIDSSLATDDEDNILSHFEFAQVVKSTPQRKSEQDTSIFKVRYKYFPEEVSDNSREFCRKMVRASKVYRKEDLDKQSSANSELAAKGESSYNIFLYKGGANCKHAFIRNIYLRKNNKKISVGQARKMITSLPIKDGVRDAARYEENDKKVAQRPIDMPNNGFKNPRTKKK